MARFTVEDCMENIENRFDMTLSAALRARQLANGSMPFVENDRSHDKPNVIALREISEGKVTTRILNTLD